MKLLTIINCSVVAYFLVFSGPVNADAATEDPLANRKEWIVEPATVHQRSQYRQDLRNGTITDDDSFDHVVVWNFSRLTIHKQLFTAPKVRQQLRSDLEIAGRASVSRAHDRIVELALQHLPAIVTDRSYHPGSRYNALLIVGDLNAREGRRFGPPSPPTASPEALPFLLNWLEQYSSDDNPLEDIVPLGALIGITRHARLGIPNEPLRQRAIRAAMQLMSQSQPPPHRSIEGHDWMRRRTVHVLAWATIPGKSPIDDEAAGLLFDSIDDAGNSLKLQIECAMAWSLITSRGQGEKGSSGEALTKYTSLSARAIHIALKEAASPRPQMPWTQTRRVVAAHLGRLSIACRNLGVDSTSLRRSPPPTEISSFRDLYCGLMNWIEVVANPDRSAGKTAQDLTEAMLLLNPALPYPDMP